MKIASIDEARCARAGVGVEPGAFGASALDDGEAVGVGLDQLEVVPDCVLAEDRVGSHRLARLLRHAASAGLERLGPEAAVGASEAHGAVQRLIVQGNLDLHAESADEVLLLVAIEDNGVYDADGSLAGVEVEAHGERQPLTVECGAAMHAFDLDDGAHWAGLLDGHFLHGAEVALTGGRIFRVVGGAILQDADELASVRDDLAAEGDGVDEVRAGERDGTLHGAGIHSDRAGVTSNLQRARCGSLRGAGGERELAGEAGGRDRGKAVPFQRAVGPVGHRPAL